MLHEFDGKLVNKMSLLWFPLPTFFLSGIQRESKKSKYTMVICICMKLETIILVMTIMLLTKGDSSNRYGSHAIVGESLVIFISNKILRGFMSAVFSHNFYYCRLNGFRI